MRFSPGPFRAARALLALTQDEVALGSDVDRRVVLRLEKASYTHPTEAQHKVRLYYEDQGLKFIGATDQFGPGVRWRVKGVQDIFHRRQIQAARVLVNISQTSLASKLKVARSVITKFENSTVKKPDAGFSAEAMRVLEIEGVDFIDASDEGGFGVQHSKALRSE